MKYYKLILLLLLTRYYWQLRAVTQSFRRHCECIVSRRSNHWAHLVDSTQAERQFLDCIFPTGAKYNSWIMFVTHPFHKKSILTPAEHG